jgi:uncharacterized protein with PQ loop repeat
MLSALVIIEFLTGYFERGVYTYMDWAIFFGTIASIFTSIRFIPQIYRSLSTRKTTDLSLTFLLFVSLQSLFLILYGITRPDNFVLYMNIFPLICTIMLGYLKLKYK